MNRNKVIAELKANQEAYDFLVIGGGATGLGVAVDAASRGYRTVLVEQHDFAKGTSNSAWETRQVADFTAVADGYILK